MNSTLETLVELLETKTQNEKKNIFLINWLKIYWRIKMVMAISLEKFVMPLSNLLQSIILLLWSQNDETFDFGSSERENCMWNILITFSIVSLVSFMKNWWWKLRQMCPHRLQTSLKMVVGELERGFGC